MCQANGKYHGLCNENKMQKRLYKKKKTNIAGTKNAAGLRRSKAFLGSMLTHKSGDIRMMKKMLRIVPQATASLD